MSRFNQFGHYEMIGLLGIKSKIKLKSILIQLRSIKSPGQYNGLSLPISLSSVKLYLIQMNPC